MRFGVCTNPADASEVWYYPNGEHGKVRRSAVILDRNEAAGAIKIQNNAGAHRKPRWIPIDWVSQWLRFERPPTEDERREQAKHEGA